MDMCRKFLQMGMTRAKRYANFKGGRKYDYVKKEPGSDDENERKGERVEREKGKEHEGKEEKENASLVFRSWWDKARMHEGYKELKQEWQRKKKAWEKEAGGGKGVKKVESKDVVEKGRSMIKNEDNSDGERPGKKVKVKRVKS